MINSNFSCMILYNITDCEKHNEDVMIRFSKNPNKNDSHTSVCAYI